MIRKGNDALCRRLDDKSSRKILAHENGLMMVEVSFEKDGVGAVHIHPHEQVSYVAKGQFLFELDGEKEEITVGDSVYIPPNTKHGLVALSDAVIVDVFTPQREDFLIESK